MKKKTEFECIECGYQAAKFFGRCPQCQAWNSFVESPDSDSIGKFDTADLTKPVKLSDIDHLTVSRLETGEGELDRVFGGGIVPGSAILIGGEPGVGKSTLLLKLSGILAGLNKKVLYYSGEESASQIKLRANRLGVTAADVLLLTLGGLEDLKAAIADEKPDYLIIDSIQTLYSKRNTAYAGSISAMRMVTAEILDITKEKNITTFIIGQINKEGQIAGPKALEHMVDVVLYFQGEIKSDLRILRAEKNRFGSINEIGIFQMQNNGLVPVSDPSTIFIQHRQKSASGIAIFPAMNGLRAILIEIQALVTETPFVGGNPRRISVGFDSYRLSMLISLIEKKLKLPFYQSDVFLNVTGGMTIKEAAADMAVITALISSYKNININEKTIFIGEIGLTGEIRPVSFLENRINESSRQGFSCCLIPEIQGDIKTKAEMKYISVSNLHELYNVIGKSNR
jgi:DNA repair protein RadA/Sms